MIIAKWRYNIKLILRDENGYERTMDELPESAWEDLVDAFSSGSRSGDIEFEDDSDEWEDINKGEERFEARNNK